MRYFFAIVKADGALVDDKRGVDCPRLGQAPSPLELMKVSIFDRHRHRHPLRFRCLADYR